MSPTDKVDLQISEDTDGSAVVVMQDDEKLLNNNANNRDNDDDDDGGDNTPDVDPAREAIRQARREERKLKKQLHREKANDSTRLIAQLRKQNDEMAGRVAVLEKRTAGADAARLDKAIEDHHLRLNYSKAKMAEATNARDGKALADAQEQWYESRRQIEALENFKRKASAEPRDSAVPRAPDPVLQRKASTWMEKNDWYDPNGKNTDSKVAINVDEELTEEGWDPKSDDYWEELDKRLTKYLPHRYNNGNAERTYSKSPRSAVTSSGRESSSATRAGEFRISPERVRAIKEAGKWDNPSERQKMVRLYAEYDRTQSRN